MIKGLSHREIYENAERGDPDAQLQLYYDPNADDGLLWLCRAADGGNPEARYRLAVLFENGADGVEQDHVSAQLWYRLASRSGHAWGNVNADRLAANSSSADSEKAQRLLEQWQAGQCELQLGFGGRDSPVSSNQMEGQLSVLFFRAGKVR
jgi:TPR repeat protein